MENEEVKQNQDSGGSHLNDGLGMVWVFDINKRTYRRDENGKPYGSPIWREHWKRYRIIGETSRSWIAETGIKVPKKNFDSRMFAFSEEEVNRAAYVEENRRKIADVVMTINDHDVLASVAALIGYTHDS